MIANEDHISDDIEEYQPQKKKLNRQYRRHRICCCYCPLMIVIILIGLGGNWDSIFKGYFAVGEYPYKTPTELQTTAQGYSDTLQEYISGWISGVNPAMIPDSLLPPGIDPEVNKDFYLQKYEDIDPATQWAMRLSKPVDVNAVVGGLPDPHVTYLLLGTSFAPFGVQLMMEGQFPYCRFFSIQITAPFDGKQYTISRTFGGTENSIVDLDINPDVGSVNPFRIGENRTATNRNYTMEFRLARGDPLTLDPNFKPPYRGAGNVRYGSFLVCQGPMWQKLSAKGEWNSGLLWVRYYAPDLDKNNLAGVSLPKVYYIDPSTNSRYFINSDFSGLNKSANTPHAATPTSPSDPTSVFGPTKGWGKSYGILRNVITGIFQMNDRMTEANMQYTRDADLYATGRGQFQDTPGNYERSATENNYSPYVGRAMNLGTQKVIVLTGQMPTFPDTRNGGNLTQAQVRYWSIGGYDQSIFRLNSTMTGCLHNIMDDEVKIDATRHYIIVYSRAEDRPTNANEANGVTWVDWGPLADLGILMRWVTVSPEWDFPQNPDQIHIPWGSADRVSATYDSSLLDTNDQKGFMGEYLPKVHYMTKADFEALGNNLNYNQIPDWVRLEGNGKNVTPTQASVDLSAMQYFADFMPRSSQNSDTLSA